MSILRSVLAVVAGYAVFALSAVWFFTVTGQPPHQAASPLLMAASVLVGIFAACFGGHLAARLAGHRPFAHGVALGVVLAAGALVSLVSTIGHGAIWSQIAALVFMAPAAVLGGWIRAQAGSE